MNNPIALLDCNNFYVSCERIFDGSIKREPVVVLSNNDGCVISRSEEAKEIGVTMGAPLFRVENLLDSFDAKIFSSNYALYGDMSGRVMNLLQKFTPDIEVYSIDEAFLSFEHRRHHSLEKLGQNIREKVYKWTGIPVSIGIAETKVLAKIANRKAKKNEFKAKGVLNLYRSSETEKVLKETLVEDIWGIGHRSALKLRQNLILNALDLREADTRFIRKLLSVFGARITLELRGIKCIPFEFVQTKKHNITCSRSFGQSITEFAELREAVLYFLTRASEKMRKDGLAANAVTVFIGTDRFHSGSYNNTATYSAAYPTDSNLELQEWTLQSLSKIFHPEIEYRKAGITLSGLIPTENLTKRIFDEEKFQQQHKLMKAIDEVNQKFGKDTVRFGLVKNENWQSKQLYKSQNYTTNWNELLRVG